MLNSQPDLFQGLASEDAERALSLGARMIPRRRFLAILRESLRAPTRAGSWNEEAVFSSAREAAAAVHPGTGADLP